MNPIRSFSVNIPHTVMCKFEVEEVEVEVEVEEDDDDSMEEKEEGQEGLDQACNMFITSNTYYRYLYTAKSPELIQLYES